MRRTALLLALGLLLAAAPAWSDLPGSLDRVRRSVVLLIVQTPQGGGSGTGFVVARKGSAAILATNHHVAGGGGTVVFRTEDGRTGPARLLGVDEKADLALLEAPGLDLHPLRMARPQEVKEGSDIGVLGYPLADDFLEGGMGIRASLSRGVVAAVRERDGITLLQVDAGMNPGNSGGPAFDYRTGRVVGVAVAKHMGAEGIGFLIRVDALQALMARHGVSAGSPKPPNRTATPRVQPSPRRPEPRPAASRPRTFPRWIVLALFLAFLLGLTAMGLGAMRSQRSSDVDDDRPIL